MKSVFKLILDLLLILAFAFMFDKMAAGINYHEYIGLTLLTVLIVHLLLNFKWFSKFSRTVWQKNCAARQRINYLVVDLIFLLFILIGISGVYISEVIFNLQPANPGFWKMIHYGTAAYALILVGVHLGLHYQFIVRNLKKLLPLPQKIGRYLGIAFSTLVLLYGAYSLATTNFVSYLSFSGGGGGHHGQHQGQPQEEQYGKQDGQGRHLYGQGNSSGQHFRQGGGVASTNIVSTIASYFSIMFVFAAITRFLEVLLRRKRN